MAPHSSTLAWKIPWTEEPGRLQSMGSLRVGHDWTTSLSLFTFMHWRRQWQPTLVLLPGKIPWTEEPGRLQSIALLRVGHDWATSLSVFTFMHWRRKWNPLQCSCLENPRDGKAWWAAVYGVAQNRTRLKRLRSSSSREQITHWDCGWSKAYRRLEERGGRFQPSFWSSRSKEWWTKWTRESRSFWVTLKFDLKREAFI